MNKRDFLEYLSTSNFHGEEVLAFNLPLALTCIPSPQCKEECNRKTGGDTINQALLKRIRAYQYSQTKDFVPDMIIIIPLLIKHGIKFLRLHTTGDFYSIEYVEKWIEIMLHPDVIHSGIILMAWTKRFDFKNELLRLAGLPNVVLRESLDPSLPEARISGLAKSTYTDRLNRELNLNKGWTKEWIKTSEFNDAHHCEKSLDKKGSCLHCNYFCFDTNKKSQYLIQAFNSSSNLKQPNEKFQSSRELKGKKRLVARKSPNSFETILTRTIELIKEG